LITSIKNNIKSPSGLEVLFMYGALLVLFSDGPPQNSWTARQFPAQSPTLHSEAGLVAAAIIIVVAFPFYYYYSFAAEL
jgi:hypothetical protein